MMKRTQVYLPEDLYKELKLFAQIKETTPSVLIRKGLLEVIRKERKAFTKKHWKGFVGAYKGKIRTDFSKYIRQYYQKKVL